MKKPLLRSLALVLVAVAGCNEGMIDSLSGAVVGDEVTDRDLPLEAHCSSLGTSVALIPATAHGPINAALKEHGVELDVSKLKPEDLEGLVEHLNELTVDVEGANGEKVRVFCE